MEPKQKVESDDTGKAAADAKALSQIEKWGDLGRPSPKLPPPGESILIEDDEDFINRLTDLGIDNIPDVAIIPRNFASAPSLAHLAFERETSDLRVLGRQAGIEVAPLVGKPAIIHENDIVTIGVVIAITLKVLEAANSTATLVDFFDRLGKFLGQKQEDGSSSERVELIQEVIITSGVRAKRLTYRGTAANLHTVVKALKDEADTLDD